MSDSDVFKDEFLPNVEGASITYAQWKKQQSAEYKKWISYRDAILADQLPEPPVLSSRFGKMLMAAGQMAERDDMKVTLSTSGGTQNLSGTVTLTATAVPSGQVTRAEFYVDDALKSTDTSGPFTYSWDTTTVSDGGHQLKARAFYPRNKVAEHKLDVTVDNIPAPPPPPPPPQDPPVNTALPTISDTTPAEGQTLFVTNGDWTNNPTSYTYQWLRCDGAGANCVLIPSATTNSYVTDADDVGATLRCAVTARNIHGASAAVRTAATSAVSAVAPAVPVSQSPPIITGSPIRGQTLHTTTGAWSNFPTLYAYQWRRCDSAGANCTDIGGPGGSNSPDYTVTSADVGLTIRAYVIAENAAGSSAQSGESAATVLVTDTPPPPPPPSGSRFVYTLGDPAWNPTGNPGWWLNAGTSTGWIRKASDAAIIPQRVYFDNTVQVMQSVVGSYGAPGTSGPCRTVAVRIDPNDPNAPGIAAGAQAAALHEYQDQYPNPLFGAKPSAYPQQGETWWYGFAMRTNAAYKAHGQDVADLTWGMFNSFGLEFHVSGALSNGNTLGPLMPEIHCMRPTNFTNGANGSIWWTCPSPGAWSHQNPPKLGISITGGLNNVGPGPDDATHTCRRFQGPTFVAGTLYKVIYKVKWDAFGQGSFDWWVNSGSGYLQYASQTGISTLWRNSSGPDTATWPTMLNYRKANNALPQSIMYYGGFIRGTTMADVTIP